MTVVYSLSWCLNSENNPNLGRFFVQKIKKRDDKLTYGGARNKIYTFWFA